MPSIDYKTSDQTREFMHSLQEWFERWFNVTVDAESLQQYEKIMHPNWRLVNKETP